MPLNLADLARVFAVIDRDSNELWDDAKVVELRVLAIRGWLLLLQSKAEIKQPYNVHPKDRPFGTWIKEYERKRGEMGLDHSDPQYRTMVRDNKEPCLHPRAHHGLDCSYCPDCGKIGDSTLDDFYSHGC